MDIIQAKKFQCFPGKYSFEEELFSIRIRILIWKIISYFASKGPKTLAEILVFFVNK